MKDNVFCGPLVEERGLNTRTSSEYCSSSDLEILGSNESRYPAVFLKWLVMAGTLLPASISSRAAWSSCMQSYSHPRPFKLYQNDTLEPFLTLYVIFWPLIGSFISTNTWFVDGKASNWNPGHNYMLNMSNTLWIQVDSFEILKCS